VIVLSPRKWWDWFFAPGGAPALILRLFSDYGRQFRGSYAVAFGCMAVSAACTAVSAYLIGRATNEAYIDRNFEGIVVIATLTVVLFVVKGLTAYGQSVTLARIANRMIAAIQKRLFDKLIEQDLVFFADRHSSEFVMRINHGATSAAAALSAVTTSLGRDLLSLLGLGAVMVYQAPMLSLVAVLVMPPAVLILRKLIKRMRNIALTQFQGAAVVIEALQETIQGLRVVKAFNLEDEMRRRVSDSIDSVERAANKLARVANRGTPLMESLGGIAIAGAMVYGGYEVLVRNAAPGEFISFITAFLLAYEPAKRLARLNLDLQGYLVGAQMLLEVLDLPSRSEDARPPLALTHGRVEFANVSFGYRSGTPVLRNLSYAAEPGAVTALVGPSGGGKTTVFNLLMKLYQPQTGAILVDGQNIALVSGRSLRSRIAYVGQDPFLFRGSIRDNIALGREGATDAEIAAAARAAYAEDFIAALPAGFDTQVGELGGQLSGGQRQRIAIARALIRDAAIILLDEPTAALDNESEFAAQRAMAKLIEGRTTLVIAHRLHTITSAKVIHYLEDGEIVESGSHYQLIAAAGRYARNYRLLLAEQPPAA
jgi:ABC-type multidrug transport system fused ATPase/permease subunit